MSERPLLLLSNDDGATAAGLRALLAVLRGLGDVVVVAPEHEQSANSHAITLSRPLRHKELEPGVHSVDGTPADCIYVGLYQSRFLPRRPRLVVSGINHGLNLGTDVFYSGTVAAAREGALRGVPSIAFSMERHAELARCAELAGTLVARLLAATLDPATSTPLLNVNFPAGPIHGVRTTRLGRRIYDEDVVVRHDPRGREYFWIGGPGARHEPLEGSDTDAIDAGFATVTPLVLEATHAPHFGLAAWVAGPEFPSTDSKENPTR